MGMNEEEKITNRDYYYYTEGYQDCLDNKEKKLGNDSYNIFPDRKKLLNDYDSCLTELQVLKEKIDEIKEYLNYILSEPMHDKYDKGEQGYISAVKDILQILNKEGE
jgi:hypothetical protein